MIYTLQINQSGIYSIIANADIELLFLTFTLFVFLNCFQLPHEHRPFILTSFCSLPIVDLFMSISLLDLSCALLIVDLKVYDSPILFGKPFLHHPE